MTISTDEVYQRLSDPEFLRRRADVDQSLGSEVAGHEVGVEQLSIWTTATVPLDWLPSQISRRVSASGTVPSARRHERWQRRPEGLIGTMEFEISGVPARASGSMAVVPAGTGSEFTQHLELGVDVPIVGKLVEAALARHLGATLVREATLFNEA